VPGLIQRHSAPDTPGDLTPRPPTHAFDEPTACVADAPFADAA
jgi:hypothetical protein